MESASFLSPELHASSVALVRPQGAGLRADGQAHEPPRGFANVLAAARDGSLPHGERLPVGGKTLPLGRAAGRLPDQEGHLASWLAAVDSAGVPFAAVSTPATAVAGMAAQGADTEVAFATRSAWGGAASLTEGPFAAAGGAVDVLSGRAAGAGAARLGNELPAVLPRLDGGVLALTVGTDDTANAVQRAAMDASLGTASGIQAPALRGEPSSVPQLFPQTLVGPASQAAASYGVAAGAVTVPRDAAASAAGSAVTRNLADTASVDAALASEASADVLLDDAVRAAAATADGEQAATLARWLGEGLARERVARAAGGAFEPLLSSSSMTSGLPPSQTVATSTASGAGAAPVATPPAYGNAAALDVHDAAWNEKLLGRIHWLVDRDIGEARIKLHPAELGALDVKISVRDEQTFVQLAASSAAARDELEQSLPRLRDLLAQNGLTLAGATVSGGRQEQTFSAYSGRDGHDSRMQTVSGVTESESVGSLHAARGSDGRIDLYA